MHAAGRASAGRDNFELALLVPAFLWGRRGRGVVLDFSQRIGTEPVAAQAAAQTEYFDEPPQPGNLHDQDDRKDPVGIGQQVRELAEQAWHDEERNDPPAAPVTIMQPLDRSCEVN